MNMSYVELLNDYQQVKENLFLRCSNTERNGDYLENCPRQEKNGLALTAHVGLNWQEGALPNYSAVVTNDMLKGWGITEETLFADATANTQKKMPPVIMKLSELMQELSGGGMMPPEAEEPDIFVLTNEHSYFGAAAAFYPDMLKSVHESLGNYFMLPSSVHEWLLLPEETGVSVRGLESMVYDVNRTELSEADYLSDDVFHFDGERMELARDYEKRLQKTEAMKKEAAGIFGPETAAKDRPITM